MASIGPPIEQIQMDSLQDADETEHFFEVLRDFAGQEEHLTQVDFKRHTGEMMLTDGGRNILGQILARHDRADPKG